jgi:hypothetical protein
MTGQSTTKQGIFRRLLGHFTRNWVAETPQDDSLCEFECRKTQCTFGEWQNCGRRLKDLEERALYRRPVHRPCRH